MKVARADRHIESLQNAILRYLRRHPFKLVIQAGPNNTREMVFKVREEVPMETSAIIGDAIHNMRTALDILACDLVRLNGANDKGVYFPFSETDVDFDDMIKRRNMHRAAPAVVDLLRTMKPYHGGNAALRGIHDLDIADKHKALIPVGGLFRLPNIRIADETGTRGLIENVAVGFVRDGYVAVKVDAMRGAEIGREIPGEYHLVFDMDVPFGAARPVVPTLQNLAQLTSGVIKSFETLCFP